MEMELVSAARMKELERAADAAGLSYRQMMENAGYQAFEEIERRCPQLKTAAVFAGKGNNSGDGFVVARLLAADGVQVRVVLCEGDPVTGDAIYEYERLEDVEIWPLDELEAEQEDELAACDVIVDALYGTGFHGELGLEQEVCCGVINSSNGLKLALDIPSGLECDSGIAAQGTVNANLTVAFHAFKPCHEKAPEICGEIILADIGI